MKIQHNVPSCPMEKAESTILHFNLLCRWTFGIRQKTGIVILPSACFKEGRNNSELVEEAGNDEWSKMF